MLSPAVMLPFFYCKKRILPGNGSTPRTTCFFFSTFLELCPHLSQYVVGDANALALGPGHSPVGLNWPRLQLPYNKHLLRSTDITGTPLTRSFAKLVYEFQLFEISRIILRAMIEPSCHYRKSILLPERQYNVCIGLKKD